MTPRQREAHERQPAGRVHRPLADEPMTEDEQRAEQQRMRVRNWHRRQNAKPAPDLSVLMEWYRP